AIFIMDDWMMQMLLSCYTK
ncbi:hypothetical protein A2U01_0082058, partial [Trifolium medium]|nr:hypothetical protein [Trifolium medium]